MVRELVTVRPETDAYDAIALLLKHRISGMPVVDESGKLLGMLSERDCLKTLLDAQYHNMPTAPVRDLMSTELKTISPDRVQERTFLSRRLPLGGRWGPGGCRDGFAGGEPTGRRRTTRPRVPVIWLRRFGHRSRISPSL